MAVMRISVTLALLALATANPATLNELYGTPGADSSHTVHGHAAEHSTHDSASFGIVGNGSGAAAAGTGNLDLDATSGAGSGSPAELRQSIFNLFGRSDSSGSGQSRDSAGILSSGSQSGFGAVSGQSFGPGSSENVMGESGRKSSIGSIEIGSFGSVSGAQPSAVGIGQSPLFGQKNLNPSLSLSSSSSEITFESGVDSDGLEAVIITQELTVDVFKTVTNVIYNTIPVTLTQFLKTTVVQPTRQVLSTPVDNAVFVATAPITHTDTITVTNTNTAHQYATEVSTDLYTITHRAYDIRQQVVTSTLVQTQVFRPTIVSTRISTEYETQSVVQTVTNTVIIEPRVVATVFASEHGAVPLPEHSQGQHLNLPFQQPGQQKHFSLQQLQTFVQLDKLRRDQFLQQLSSRQRFFFLQELRLQFGDVFGERAFIHNLQHQHSYL